MKSLFFGIASLMLLLASNAHATTFSIDYTDRPSADPAEGFEVDCLGPTEAEDCADRAAALQAELVDVLGSLSWRNAPEDSALFEALVSINDPRLQEVGLRYFARQAPPATLWDKAREFFFGPDANTGHPSAEILAQSSEEIDQALAETYLTGRSQSARGGDLPDGSGETDSWAQGSADDALFDEVYPFTEEERFANASRLLMIDRFNIDLYSGEPTLPSIPVTGYVTDASIEEVSAHFNSVFGSKPYPSANASRDAQQALFNELLALQQRLAGGDMSVLKRLEEIPNELETAQTATLLATRLNLEGLGCGDHIFWTNTPSEEATTGPLQRAVVVGTDAQLDRTVLRYISGAVGAPTSSDGGAAGTGGIDGSGGRAQGGRSGNAGANNAGTGSGTKHDDSGCGCSLPGRSSSLTPWAVVGMALGLLRGGRRRRQ